MKKSLIFALTALLAVSFTFFSCKPNEDESKDNTPIEQPSGEDKGDTGNETNKPSEDNPSTDDPKEDTPSEKKAYNIDLSTAELVKEDWASVAAIDVSGSELIYTAVAWGSKIDFKFSDNLDLSKYTKISVTAYADSDYKQDTQEFKVEFYTDDSNGTELCNAYSEGFLVLSTTSDTYTADLSKGGQLYGLTGKADFSKISKIRLNAQTGNGKVYIAKIHFE